MSTMRTRRLGSLLQAELAALLHRQVKDPRLAQVTLTGVNVAPDLSQAKIFFTLHREENRLQAEKGFKAAAPFLRTRLAAALHLKTVPRLVAVFDNSIIQATHLESLIKQARAQDEQVARLAEKDSS